MTDAATDFVQPLTFSTLSNNVVYRHISHDDDWSQHVELGLWADLMIIAPCTANTISGLANGLANNMILVTYLSARCPVWVYPAMDVDMWHHASTQRNIARLRSDGVMVAGVDKGFLASGLNGEGRMQEPEAIFEQVTSYFNDGVLKGKTVVITAGPTYEKIDPVRFIGNRSSGKMGLALANSALSLGADVTLILGPNHLTLPKHDRLTVVAVESAREMYEATKKEIDQYDIAIMAAAVADYTLAKPSDIKIKKQGGEDELHLTLEETVDIAAVVGKAKKAHQILVGFALETNNESQNARKKLDKKGLDMIVLNSLRDKGAGFSVDTNKITIITKDNKVQEFELKSKSSVSDDIFDSIIQLMRKHAE